MAPILYESLGPIACGSFGVVFKAKNKITQEIYALKIIKCYSNKQVQNAVNESNLMRGVMHPHIVRLRQTDLQQVAFNQINVRLLFEYCAGGNLNDRLQRQSTQTQQYRWMKEITNAVAYLHYKNIVHRDLKPANILLTESPREQVKVGDFGISKMYPINLCIGTNSSISQMYLQTIAGTPWFTAPEVYRGRYTEKADIFSLGLIFYCIQERPFINFQGKIYYAVSPSLGQRMNWMRRNIFLQFQSSTPALINVISSCLEYHYKQRPSAAGILNYLSHTF